VIAASSRRIVGQRAFCRSCRDANCDAKHGVSCRKVGVSAN
jgi:hypothetical protein